MSRLFQGLGAVFALLIVAFLIHSLTSDSGFKNPGGMWRPGQLTEPPHADYLKKLGLELPAQDLSDPKKVPLDAIVSLGYCSGSFVSPTGLVATNYHCAKGCIQFASNKDQGDYLTKGYVASSRKNEKPCAANERFYVTLSMKDVTKQVIDATEKIGDPIRRAKTIKRIRKELIEKCEHNRPHLRCEVAKFFKGAEYSLITKMQIKDVRLVYSPHKGVGEFGGDTDNWMWPRHTGDYTFLRAYVNREGKPAPYATDNVPYKSKSFLKLASKPLNVGDLVMIAGYPGNTDRQVLAVEVEETVNWDMPRLKKIYKDWHAEIIKTIESQSSSEAKNDLKIKSAGLRASIQNGRKYFEESFDRLTELQFVEKKKQREEEIEQWISSDKTRKEKYGDVIGEMRSLYVKYREHKEREKAQSNILRRGRLGVAVTIVQMAKERPKIDLQRKMGFQKRDWEKRIQSLSSKGQLYNRALDQTNLRFFILNSLSLPEVHQPKDLFLILFGKTGGITELDVDSAIDEWYEKTDLEDPFIQINLFRRATLKSLSQSQDPFIQHGLSVLKLIELQETKDNEYEGRLVRLLPKYLAAIKEYALEVDQSGLAPDANSTLRVSYGTVRGYKNLAGEKYFPFTKLSEVKPKMDIAVREYNDAKSKAESGPEGEVALKKAQVKRDEFLLPESWLTADKNPKKDSPYYSKEIDAIPVNFLSDVDSTGGNSGSATFNSRGEIVGLLFDGTSESMYGDWVFNTELQRSIHVDMRYALWVMENVDKADYVLNELRESNVR